MKQLHCLLCSFTLMKLASIWPRPGVGGQMWLDREPLWMSPTSVEEISPCVPPQVCKDFSITTLVPDNLVHMITFLDTLHNAVAQDGPEQPKFVVIWDNVSFHWAALVNFSSILVPLLPVSQSLWGIIFSLALESGMTANHMPVCLFCKQWKRHAEVGSVQGWIRHTSRYFPYCLAREDIAWCHQNIRKHDKKLINGLLQWLYR